MLIRPLHKRLVDYVGQHNLTKLWNKQKRLFELNPLHPSLHTELLEPKQYKIYSFRLSRKYRAIFVYRGIDQIEIIDINDHYQ